MTPHAPHVLVATDAVGGVWRYSLALAGCLAAGGVRCTLAVLGPTPDARQRTEAEAAGCTLVETGLALDWTMPDRASLQAASAALAALARRCRADLLHLHAPCLAAGREPFSHHVPVVAVAHSCTATWWAAMRPGQVMPADFAWRADATRDGIVAADTVVAPSRAFADALRETYGTRRDIHVVHNGLPEEDGPAVAREDFVLAAGRLWDEAKNLRVLDAAAASMHAGVHAAGPLDGPNGARIALPRLHTPGNLAPAALRAVMARAAVFASPARYEPFGLAVLEAAQTGAPLVLADIPTARELWDGAALFVPAEDAPGWAAALDGLVRDAGARAALGDAARERARRYTHAAMVSATAALHTAVLARARRAA